MLKVLTPEPQSFKRLAIHPIDSTSDGIKHKLSILQRTIAVHQFTPPVH
ncbi:MULTISPECIES: hypothetical protein [Pseudomonadati]|uniref:Uncharacterized protein n=1 Tax=Shewanella aestuarii TaxID=1028752 RepID=A0ABT0L1I8_9GAMM|nr:hypothetical protein [Shewanella aestuarii]MCL1117555.1 hypothetical protein [Shewanella aestuarii]